MPEFVFDEIAERLYAWERNVYPMRKQPFMSQIAAATLVNHMWRFHGREMPAPVVRSLSVEHVATGGRQFLTIPMKMSYKTVVLHELAHALGFDDDNRPLYDENPHGPKFARRYCDLLVQHMGAQMDHLVETAHRFGVKIEGYEVDASDGDLS